MGERMKFVGGALLAGVALAGSLAAQTDKNPISTKPEGTTPNCTYSGGVSNGKVTNSSACRPGTTPGADPNQIAPVVPAQRFPFPGETPDMPGAPSLPPTPTAPGDRATSPASAPGQAPAVPANPAQRFPFPGEPAGDMATPGSTGNPAQGSPAQGAPALRDAGSSGDSSSSSSSSSSSKADPGFSSSNAGPDLPDDDPNAPMPTPHHVVRKKLPKEKKPLSTDEQEAEDVQVAGFYQNDGNFKAAYERAKEAVGLVAEDPEAHVALADAARKLGKLDEAKLNYQKALELDPVPKVRKAAEKALKEMSGG